MKVAAIREALKRALLEINPSSTWPVNVHAILSRLGIQLSFTDAPDKRVSYLEVEGTPRITICRKTAALFLSPRERFSIAHELAHWVIWRRFGSLPSSESEYWFHETLCNEFAAGLLVPEPALSQFLDTELRAKTHPVYFPSRIVRLAAVSWDVAAKSIAAFPSSDSAYIRLAKVPYSLNKGPSETFPLKVSCTTIAKPSGTYLGRSALLRNPDELLNWLKALPNRTSASRPVSVSLGTIQLNQVPCTVLREMDNWTIHFHPSSSGVARFSQDADA
jgi:hypothetical protein